MSGLNEEAIRADERRRMDHAITWDVTCFGCADRMDGLIAERHAGYVEALRDVERALAREGGYPGEVRALEFVRGLIAKAAETAVGASQGGPEGAAQGQPL